MKKVVMNIELPDEKMKQKAIKIVSDGKGVNSISAEVENQKLTVIGDVDPALMVTKLRKLCPTDILTIGPAEEPAKKSCNPNYVMVWALGSWGGAAIVLYRWYW